MRKMAATATVGKGAPSARGERGVILLVVLALLQLLSLIGIAFTVYAAHGGPRDAIASVEQDILRARPHLPRSSRIPTTPRCRSRRS
jgi:hypothetical protein